MREWIHKTYWKLFSTKHTIQLNCCQLHTTSIEELPASTQPEETQRRLQSGAECKSKLPCKLHITS